ncbi:FixH family protein [Poseidonibacter lekithochrous]|uniref:FixH family protein n=1 Tax=Poseidonibacter TaxID=2321187 RepID=UPI001C094C55|nr:MULTISPECIES: FixH family protein [Poseidonibacter]MBU3014320.1 FixH family protein [Poseidonibacter lekithochrous]MDO6827618.1 FixH family protein [Poseidonibacter sp. 1_MG-2023]
MKNLFKIIVAMFLTLGFLNAEPLEQVGEKNGYEVNLTSDKSLIVGNNDLFVVLSKDGNEVKDVKVKIKVFMPEMPGMPYMEYKAKAKFIDGKYKMMVNFSMGGTWQYHLKFKSKDGKIHTIRGSVNI